MSAPAVTAPRSDTIASGAQVSDLGSPETELPAISFVRPIPGFADLTRFALVRLDHAGSVPDAEIGADDEAGVAGAPAADDGVDAEADGDSLLFELRSLEASDVRFLVAAPAPFFPDYAFDLDDDAVADLGLDVAEDALILVVLTVGADSASTTANLLAPVVVNVRTRSAAQVILTGTEWPVRAAVV